MRSMTGFGVGEAPLAGGKVILEARSLNHRFLDVRVNLPTELLSHSFYLEQLARERLRRGRYAIGGRYVYSQTKRQLDLDRARAAFRDLSELRDELAPGSELPLCVLAAMPELFQSSGEPDPDQAREALALALDNSLDALTVMRTREGEALARDLRYHLDEARRICLEITGHSHTVVDAYRERLRDRIDRLLRGCSVTLDPGRLEVEVAIVADRSDIAEELARLESHIEQFLGLLDHDQPVGRTMDFLLQEMAREANTIGSKSQDAALAKLVVDLRSALERMREQVQNAE